MLPKSALPQFAAAASIRLLYEPERPAANYGAAIQQVRGLQRLHRFQPTAGAKNLQPPGLRHNQDTVLPARHKQPQRSHG
jgi:hypothetical protein